jgi:hypothetical protein
VSTPTVDPRVAYQIGFLLGRGFTREQIDQFAALMATEPSVRPAPRSQRPRHVLHPTDTRTT